MAGLKGELSEIVARIYESATSEAALDEIIASFGRAFPHTRSALVAYYRQGDRLDAVARSDFERQAAYVAYYKNINPWLPPMEALDVGAVVQTDELVDRRSLMASEFYNDFLRSQRGIDVVSGIGAVVHRDTSGFVAFGAHFGADYETDADRVVALRRAISALTPHVQRAWALRRRFVFLNERVRNLENLLDAIDDAVLHVNAESRIIYANGEARRLLSEGDGLQVRSANRLGCREAADEEALQEAVRKAAAMSPARGSGQVGVVAVRRRRATPLAVFAAPLRDGSLVPAPLESSPSVVVFVADPRRRRVPPERVVQLVLGLTPAESQVAVGLASGMTARQFAEARGLSLNTVRNQLNTILNKTGCSRQTELVSLLARCLSPLGDSAAPPAGGGGASPSS